MYKRKIGLARSKFIPHKDDSLHEDIIEEVKDAVRFRMAMRGRIPLNEGSFETKQHAEKMGSVSCFAALYIYCGRSLAMRAYKAKEHLHIKGKYAAGMYIECEVKISTVVVILLNSLCKKKTSEK